MIFGNLEQSLIFTAGIIAMCVSGSALSIRMLGRFSTARNQLAVFWALAFAVVAGSTAWSINFLGYLTGEFRNSLRFDPYLTVASLFIPICAAVLCMVVMRRVRLAGAEELGAAIFGAGLAAMHIVAAKGMYIDGRIVEFAITIPFLFTFETALMAFAVNRVVRPFAGMCRWGALGLFVIAVVGGHHLVASGITPGARASNAELSLAAPASSMTFAVVANLLIMLLAGISTYMIETLSDRDAQRRLHEAVRRDALTGLTNRTGLTELLEGCLTRPGKRCGVALVLFDLDGFKPINDLRGYAAGDAMLLEIARRLKALETGNVSFSRLGGDEFLCVARGISSPAEGRALADRILTAVREPLAWQGETLVVTASAGMILYPRHNKEQDGLLLGAGLALHRAKELGGNNVVMYDETLAAQNLRRLQIIADLRSAVKRDEFGLFLQPQNDATSGELIGFEALLRWNHPDHGMVDPAEFIPLAEESRLIVPIGAWVLRAACMEAASWTTALPISVNVAAAQIGDGKLVGLVSRALAESGLHPSRLELEITESSLIDHEQDALGILEQLRALGVRIAMDDYGTGYSSLSTLKSFPFDKIKIDRTFVTNIETDKQSEAIVRASLVLARTLGITALVEGVETQSQLAYLAEAGCEAVQGYLFGKPIPAETAREHYALAASTLEKWKADAQSDTVRQEDGLLGQA